MQAVFSMLSGMASKQRTVLAKLESEPVVLTGARPELTAAPGLHATGGLRNSGLSALGVVPTSVGNQKLASGHVASPPGLRHSRSCWGTFERRLSDKPPAGAGPVILGDARSTGQRYRACGHTRTDENRNSQAVFACVSQAPLAAGTSGKVAP